jgi:predicted alpha/beta superfamily hydrolase
MVLTNNVVRGAVVAMLLSISWVGWTEETVSGELVTRERPAVSVDNWSFRSASLERTYDVSVGLPLSYEAEPEKSWPAIIVLDGNRVFGMALDIARGLSQSGDVEDLFIISIGTPYEEGSEAWTRRRVHEFSPDNEWPLTDPFGKLLKQACEGLFKLSTDECLGGAPEFLSFISGELLPALNEKYRIDHDRLGLFGVSAGGFFASWTLLHEGSPFRYFIISSPAMAYGDGEIMRLEARWAEKHDDLVADVYMAGGMLETNSAFLEGSGKIISGMAELSGMLASRNYPSFSLVTEMHPDLGHSDAAAATLAIGLRRLYGKPPPQR